MSSHCAQFLKVLIVHRANLSLIVYSLTEVTQKRVDIRSIHEVLK